MTIECIEWPIEVPSPVSRALGIKTHQCRLTAGHHGMHVCWCTEHLTEHRDPHQD